MSLDQVRIASSSTPAAAMNRRTFMLSEANKAKFWLDPVRLQNSGGFSRTEINRIQDLVEENQELLLERWNEFYNG